MSAIVAQPPDDATRVTIDRSLANGSSVTYTRVPDVDFALRYDIRLDDAPLGMMVLLVAPVTNERLWLTSFDGVDWLPPVSNQREAMRFLLPIKPAC